MKKFNKEYIHSDSSSEIDFELYDELYGKTWQGEEGFDYGDFTIVGENKAPWAGDSYPTNLNKLIKTLQEFKDKGCTHVEIMYHCDHIGYELSGLKFSEI